MRRAIVHIGLPRTGTTSFQRLLDRHRTALARAGILYPMLEMPGETPHLSHQALGEALDGRRPRAQREQLLAALRAQLGTHDTVLLSYESLCLIPWWRGAPGLLARLFAEQGYAMELLATVKPQAELLNSTYTWRMQFLRERRSFTEFCRAEIGSGKLHIARMVERWCPAANGRVTLVPVRDRLSNAPLVQRLFEAIGAPAMLDQGDVAVLENASPGPLALAIDRHLAGKLKLAGAEARQLTRAVEQATRAAGRDLSRFNGLKPDFCERAAERWRRSNDRIARRAWGTDWESRVAHELPQPVNIIDETNMDAETASLFRAIVNELVPDRP